MEEIYVNVEYAKSVHSRSSANQTGPRSSERRFYGAAVLCLGLLSVFLLVGLISLGVHYHNSERAAEHLTIKANMTKILQNCEKELSSLTKERDRLLNLTRKTCPAGWTQFSGSCYILSSRSDSWTNGRSDCQNKRADLVIINSAEEQKFLSGFSNVNTWIGLSDRDEEGKWKWVDGTPLTLTYWNQGEPNNRAAEPGEDCAQLQVDKGYKWNDLLCGKTVRWICEKAA
ncbi:CD209 antigen-like protein C [Channa argus]|uniref:CD209 antigen-like protein C n=1 Tax=Channa argus TaxID=215402 RepID=UPI00294830BF|nr:hypothetical protein Q8A73_009664 [Channa argus]